MKRGAFQARIIDNNGLFIIYSSNENKEMSFLSRKFSQVMVTLHKKKIFNGRLMKLGKTLGCPEIFILFVRSQIVMLSSDQRCWTF